jgi:hypothetical protein
LEVTDSKVRQPIFLPFLNNLCQGHAQVPRGLRNGRRMG